MTLFVIACVGLLLLCCLFFMLPGRRAGGDELELQRANLEWYRRRELELGNAEQALQRDAQLRLLEDEQIAVEATTRSSPGARAPLMLLPLGIALAAALIYLNTGAALDVDISQRLQSLDSDGNRTEMVALMNAVEIRSAQRPANSHYLVLLGRFYMNGQDYGRALGAYEKLLALVPDDAEVLAHAAQAEYLAGARTLPPQAAERAERALDIDPRQRTALGLLGMSAFEAGDHTRAIHYWERLLAVEPAGSEGAALITDVIARARAHLGEPAEVPISGAAISVRVEFPQGSEVSSGDTVFVFVRDPTAASRMPIAAVKLRAEQLPMTVRLDDSNSMAGQTLEEATALEVTARVSTEGRVGSAASWHAKIGPLTADDPATVHRLLLKPGSG